MPQPPNVLTPYQSAETLLKHFKVPLSQLAPLGNQGALTGTAALPLSQPWQG